MQNEKHYSQTDYKRALTIASTPTHNKRFLVSAIVYSCAGEACRSTNTKEEEEEMKTQTAVTRTMLHALVVCIFATLGAQAADTNQGSIVAFDTVNKYLKERSNYTTIQDQRAQKEIVGKVIEGTIEVRDVIERGDAVVIEAYSIGTKLRFKVTEPQLKNTATELKKGATVQIRATLESFWRQGSGYSNVSGTDIAEFKDVQSIVVQKTPDKK